MSKRRSRHSRQTGSLHALRLAIDCMPVATREAMLAGVRTGERIIVGAYVDGRGGVCPMLAAHRRGARTDVGAFPVAWDAFARARRDTLAACVLPAGLAHESCSIQRCGRR